MAFQSTVNRFQPHGVVGEIIRDGPTRAITGILASTSAANNVVGRAFRHVAGNDTDVTSDSGVTVLPFAGILVNPKVYATSGPVSGTLDPTLVLRNEEQVELLEMGKIIVSLSTDAAIGENVFYADDTGILAAAPTDNLTGHQRIVGARVIERNIGAAGLAIIALTY